MKTLLSSLLSLLLVSAAWASGPIDTKDVVKGLDTKSTGKKFAIATVVKVDGIAWFDRMREGVKQFKDNTGQDTWMVGPSQTDAAAQVQIIENLIAQGVDAICVVPFSVEAVEPVLKKARQRGIIVIAHEASNIKNADFVLEAFDNLISYQKANFPKMELVTKRLETYDDANTDYNKLKEALLTYPKLKGVVGGPMPTSAGAGKLITEKGLKDKMFFAGTGLVSVAGEYLKTGAIQYIQFWDPAVAGYAMNTLAVLALSEKKDMIKAGLNLGLPGYTDLKTPDAKKPNLLYGAGWVGVTKENMSEYNF